MHHYQAYQLNIESQIPLPELIPGSKGPPDVTIKRGKTGYSLPITDHTQSHFYMRGDEAYLFWEDVGAFLVRRGREIILEAKASAEEQIIRLPLLGMVLSAVLYQRKILGLHASGIAINGGAIAFLGNRGRGKSTMAAALHGQGYPLLGDDLVALSFNGNNRPEVRPGFPLLKLMPEAAAAALGDNPADLRQLIPGYKKRGREASNGFSQTGCPLKRLYVLSEGPAVTAEMLSAQEALMEVMRQSYAVRVFKPYLKGNMAAQHFEQCARLVNSVPVFRLQRPKSLSLLPEVVKFVVDQHA